MSQHYAEHREEQKRLRVVAFAFLTPFFFLKGGLNVSLAAVGSNLGLLAVLLAAKMLPKSRSYTHLPVVPIRVTRRSQRS